MHKAVGGQLEVLYIHIHVLRDNYDEDNFSNYEVSFPEDTKVEWY